MSAPLRVRDVPSVPAHDVARDDQPSVATSNAKDYIARLVKLIPSEVVGLYLVGRSAIETRFLQEDAVGKAADKATAAVTQATSAVPSHEWEVVAWVLWTLVCLGAVIISRMWTTSDQANKVPVEWPAVGIAAVSFLIWVYTFGDVFRRAAHIWDPLPATLLVLAWTFIVPFVYREK